MADVVAANRDLPASAGRLRLTYTSGEGPLGSDRGTGPVTLCAVAAPATPWPPTATVATVPWCRNERSPLAGVKSTSYAENAVALARAKRQGAGEALLANTRGELCEGTGSNIFLLLDGALVTPPVSSGCLPGITRELVLEWLGGHEEAVPMAQLPGAEEMFLTSSTRNVHPISRVDVSELSTTRGETLAREFAARMLDEPDP
jgi:branched-chain amino acid aminotransferase